MSLVLAADQSLDLIKLISTASAPTLLAVIVVGAFREWWVPGPTHKRTVDERDALLKLALGNQELGARAIDTAASIIENSARRKREHDVP